MSKVYTEREIKDVEWVNVASWLRKKIARENKEIIGYSTHPYGETEKAYKFYGYTLNEAIALWVPKTQVKGDE